MTLKTKLACSIRGLSAAVPLFIASWVMGLLFLALEGGNNNEFDRSLCASQSKILLIIIEILYCAASNCIGSGFD